MAGRGGAAAGRRVHRDGEHQRDGAGAYVCHPVGMRRHPDGGGRAGEDAGAPGKGQAGGRVREHGVKEGGVAAGGHRQSHRRNCRALRVGHVVDGRVAEGRDGRGHRHLVHRDADGQRGLVGAGGAAVRVARRVGVAGGGGHGGGRAGEDAGGRVKGQAGDGRGQRVGDGAVAAGGRRQGQVNRRAYREDLRGDGRGAEGRGGVSAGGAASMVMLNISETSSVPAALPSVSPAV